MRFLDVTEKQIEDGAHEPRSHVVTMFPAIAAIMANITRHHFKKRLVKASAAYTSRELI